MIEVDVYTCLHFNVVIINLQGIYSRELSVTIQGLRICGDHLKILDRGRR